MHNIKRYVWPCLFWVGVCLIISGFAGWVTEANIPTWYAGIQKPSFNPPDWLFAPVWTVLYIMIGISGGILWAHRRNNMTAFVLYLLQLLLNFCWSFIFFGAHQIGWALLDIVFLIMLIACTIICAYRAAKPAAFLLVPYFIWVIFAFTLNYGLWYLN